ncbi:MAG: O-antigen ligase family protein [Nitrospirae bacterium]|nr:O-antigen ligase family protein [Nitrospirota bacterium]
MIEISLFVIVMLSAILFGAVESWSIAISGVLTAGIFIFFIMKQKSLTAFSDNKGLYPLLLIFLYPIFQLLPLPLAMIGIPHPEIKDLVTLSPDISTSFHSISIYPFATEREMSRLTIYLMIFLTAAFGLNSREQAYKIIKALAIFGFILSIFAIIQYAAWNGRIYWFRELTHGGAPFGPFVNKNHFAGFIGMIIPLPLGIALMSGNMEKKIRYGFLSVVMAIALFFSLSRGGIISFFAGILVFALVIFLKALTKKRLVPILMFVLTLILYLLYLGMTPIIDRFAQTDVTNEQRFIVWLGTLSAIKDYLVFGSGLGTYQHIFKLYKPEGVLAYYDHAHNDYLELLLEVGIVGAIITAIFLFFALRPIIKAELQGREIYLKAGFLSSLSTIAVHSITDFNLHIPSNAMLFFLILGIAASSERWQKEKVHDYADMTFSIKFPERLFRKKRRRKTVTAP